MVLCERGELGTLVDLPYKEKSSELEDEVVDILESRARAIDLTKHNYYHLLYAFHVYRLNYRKGEITDVGDGGGGLSSGTDRSCHIVFSILYILPKILLIL